MDITDVPEHRYEGYLSYSVSYIERGDFTIPSIVNEWEWRTILSPRLTIVKYNWRCKACKEKILDDVQVVTRESHMPAYHVNCWRVLYERILHDITRTNDAMFHQIDEVELTPCLNVNDVPNEP